jgi:hypothetical protein
VCTIVRRQKDSSVLAYFARESIVRSRGRGVELAYAKGIAYRNYHKHLQVQYFPVYRFKRTTRRLFCTESLFPEVPGLALRINTISPILRPP